MYFTMIFDHGEKGKELRKIHNYKKIEQQGSEVEFEFKPCGDESCFCRKPKESYE